MIINLKGSWDILQLIIINIDSHRELNSVDRNNT